MWEEFRLDREMPAQLTEQQSGSKNMLLRILAGLCGVPMVAYGIYMAVEATINPSLRMYWTQGG